jgi:hypothetical protein
VQYIITPPNNLASSFTVTAGGHQIVVPVTVVPTSVGATFSSATPNINDTVTVTAPAGLKFDPTSSISFATGGAAIVTSFAADSSAISFVPMVGSTGVATITHVIPTYVAGLSLTLPATSSITVPNTGRPGTDAIATAPTLTLPGPGVREVFVDGGPFAANAGCAAATGGTCRLYKLVVAAPTTITVTATWESTADIGIYFLNAAGVADVFGDFACDQHGSGATSQPETCTETIPAGTFYLAAVNFSATAPAFFTLLIDGQ